MPSGSLSKSSDSCLDFDGDVAFSRKLAYKHAAFVADKPPGPCARRSSVPCHSGNVYARLVRESVLAHVRLVFIGQRFAISSTYRERSVSSSNFLAERTHSPSLSCSAGMIEQRLAFPHLSPSPLMVPCTMRAAFLTATMEFATAQSESLCACMPSFLPRQSVPDRAHDQSVRRSAVFRRWSRKALCSPRPGFRGGYSVASAYSGLDLKPSKKCSAS